MWSTTARAASCSFQSVTAVNFGTYDVFGSANVDSTGSISIRCSGNPSWVLLLDKGANASTYLPRKMVNTGTLLNYNLYTDAARTAVWGDGTGGTVTVSGSGNGTFINTVYGRIPPGQDARAGLNSDTVVVTVNF
ncbi:MAG: spore coat protein U domain-containing protein [Deltaproteobacteria bacterium]|nr:spore coat protein U domain-containing protein [Deltaproteobacteria bacterium]